VFAGVLAPLKRPADLIEAHARLRAQFPDLATILCGPVEDATYASAMKRLIAERNIDGVTFAGLTDQQRLAELLSGAVALVLPSVQENAPMVIAEAMAMGVPVVATRVGGTSSLVRDGETGWLYECGAVDELTEALRRLLLDPALRDRFGRTGRCIAEHDYRPARVAQATLDVYSQVLSARTPTKRAHV
jgi:glycosyltransferase involved in cell wall biosynthesis